VNNANAAYNAAYAQGEAKKAEKAAAKRQKAQENLNRLEAEAAMKANENNAIRARRAKARDEEVNQPGVGGLFGNNNNFAAANAAPNRVNNFGQNVGGLFENAPNAPEEYDIAKGMNNSVKSSVNLEKNMANQANRALSRSLKRTNPLTNANKNLEAFEARKRAEAKGKPFLTAGAAAAASRPGEYIFNNAPPLQFEEESNGGNIFSVDNLTPDERQRYNAMRNLNESISEANALGMIQQNRNKGTAGPAPRANSAKTKKNKKKGKQSKRSRRRN
jgi:hypothetical protein